MIRIQADALSNKEKTFIHHAIVYTLDYLISRRKRRNYRMTLEIRARDPEAIEESDCKALTTSFNDGTYKVWVYDKLINKRGKSLMGKLGAVLAFIFHELVHVKQFMLNELVDISETHYRFKGKVFRLKDEELMDYYSRPEEIEAYGMEVGLRERFTQHWKEVCQQN